MTSALPATPATPETPAVPEEKTAPRLLPITIVLCALFWMVATTGGYQVFVKEYLGSSWDSQGEHFLQGNVNVDPQDISSEAMIVNGQPRMYFGPFPALFRIPLNFIYPSGRGTWSRLAGFCAGVIALISFAGLVSAALRSSKLSRCWKTWVGSFCIVGFAFGSPLLFFVGSPTIYNEAIIWGLAWSIASLHFAVRTQMTEGKAQTRALLGFSFCVGATVLARVTFAAPLLLMVPVLGFGLLRKKEIRNLAALCLPAGIALLAYLLLNHAKFGSFGGMNLDYYINGPQKEFAKKYGLFDLHRVPYSFADYFALVRPLYQHSSFPFLQAERFHWYPHPTLFVMPLSETFSSLLWFSSWVLLGTVFGMILLFWPGRTDMVDRGIALALLFQVLVILSFMGLAQRYIAEIYPFLIFCFIIFLRGRGPTFVVVRIALFALVLISITINTLGTASILGNDGNLPVETRSFWTLGKAAK